MFLLYVKVEDSKVLVGVFDGKPDAVQYWHEVVKERWPKLMSYQLKEVHIHEGEGYAEPLHADTIDYALNSESDDSYTESEEEE